MLIGYEAGRKAVRAFIAEEEKKITRYSSNLRPANVE